MKFRTCSIALLLAICCAGALQAATYSVNVPCVGTHPAADQHSFQVDFGRSFTSIQSVSIAWSGKIHGGQAIDLSNNYSAIDGIIRARLWDDNNDISKEGITPYLGKDTYPNSEPFDCTTTLKPYLRDASWDFLLDGKAQLTLTFDSVTAIPEIMILSQPSYQLYGASLIIDGTPAPEPGSIVALLAGIAGCVPFIRRRK